MQDVGRQYSKLLHETTGFWGAYPPIIPIAVGDYVQLSSDGMMINLGSALDRFNWRRSLVVDTTDIEGAVTYYAGSKRKAGGNLDAHAASTAVTSAGAQINVSFSRSGGFVLDYLAAKHHRFRDMTAAKRRLDEVVRSADWDRSWVLITEVIEAGSATSLISYEASSSIALNATAAVAVQSEAVNLADAKLGLRASGWEGGGFVMLCKSATPMFHCARVHKSWVGRPRTAFENFQPADLDRTIVDSPFADED